MSLSAYLVRGICLATLVSSSGLAQGDTLQRVKSNGEISIGFRADQFPFSYEGAKRKPVGYTIDLCHRIIGHMQEQFGKEPIRLRMIPLNPGNRVAMVANGSVDMECDLSTINPGREDQVAFLDPTFIGSTKVLVRAAAGISAVADLAGKRLVVVAGSSNVQAAMKLNADRGLMMKVIPVKDDKEATRMLEAGSGDGFLSSDVLIYGAIIRSDQPGKYKVLDEALAKRTYGIMIRHEDEAFRAAANGALHGMMKSGEFEAVYQSWFQSPVEPDGLNLKMPMSEDLGGRVKAAKDR
jgi:ABC-type amino acid transport substrate-binding protein